MNKESPDDIFIFANNDWYYRRDHDFPEDYDLDENDIYANPVEILYAGTIEYKEFLDSIG